MFQKEVKEFEHRVPLQWVTHLSIEGDAQINHVQWGGKYYVSNSSFSLYFLRSFEDQKNGDNRVF